MNQEHAHSQLTMLKRLADFAERFRTPGANFGEGIPITGDGTAQNPYHMPYYSMSDLGASFFEMAYDSGWVREWSRADWAHGPEGQALAHDRRVLAQADFEQLAKLMTALVRQERICDGALGAAFDSGLLLAIAERAEKLLDAYRE
jgi:hypothetical protein